MTSILHSKSSVTLRAVHFEEQDDLVIRIYTNRGSFPIVIVNEGKQVPHEEIGKALCDGLNYYIPIEKFNPNPNN